MAALDRLAADTTKASVTVSFRLQSIRAAPQLHVSPTQFKVLQYADLLLAELEGLAAGAVAAPRVKQIRSDAAEGGERRDIVCKFFQ